MGNKKIRELPLTETLDNEDLAVIDQLSSSTKAVKLSVLSEALNKFTDEYRTKLEGIEYNANNYIHPENHPASMITEDDENQFVSLTEKERWNDTYTIEEVENKLRGVLQNIDWKESVETFGDIIETYPNPEDGWTVNVKDTNITYRYDGENWIKISSNSIPTATMENDGLLSKEDKIKLDSIEKNANNYRHPENHTPDIISETTQKQFVSSEDKKNWSAKETVDGAQEKADTAKNEAIDTSKNYTDTAIASHNHDKKYASIDHNHDNVYSKSDHEHTYEEIKEKPLIPTKVSELENDLGFITNGNVEDSKHTHPNLLALNKVTDSKIKEWDSKSTFSGRYDDLTNKPVIPEPADVNKAYVDEQLSLKSDKTHNHDNLYSLFNHTHIKEEITDLPEIPTKTSDLENDAGFITSSDIDMSQNHIHSNLQTLNKLTEPMIEHLLNPFDGNYSSLVGAPTNISYFVNDAGYVDSSHNHDGRYTLASEVYTKDLVYTKDEIDLILENYVPAYGGTGTLKSFIKSVEAVDLSYDGALGVYKHTIVHNLDTENIILRMTEPVTNENMVASYRSLDKNSVEIYMEVKSPVNVLIISDKYKADGAGSGSGGGWIDPDLYLTKSDFDAEMTKYVKKEIGKGLSSNDFTDALKLKVESFEIYTHPLTHPATMITEDATHKFTTLTEKEKWNNKLDEVRISDNIITFYSDSIKKYDIAIPVVKKISELQNDSGFITIDEVSDAVHKHDNLETLNKINEEKILKWDSFGNYNNLENKPTIPNAVSQLANDSGYITKQELDEKISEIEFTSLMYEESISKDTWQDSSSASGNFEKTITHNLNSESIVISSINSITKESLFIPYRIIDKNNVVLYTDEKSEVKVSIVCTKTFPAEISRVNMLSLNTNNKTNIVSAINELVDRLDKMEKEAHKVEE